MNYSIIVYILGWIMNVEAVCMLVPSITALIYREKAGIAFVITILACLAIGVPLVSRKPSKKAFYAREGLVTTALSWIVLSIVGAVPFVGLSRIPLMLFLRLFPVSLQPVPVFSPIHHRCLTASISGDVFPTGSVVWVFWYLS